MRFDPALAAQEAFRESQGELGPGWETAVALEQTFSSTAGTEAREAYERLLALAQHYPNARSFHAFCIYITWQQAAEEMIAHHFQTGLALCEAYLVAHKASDPVHTGRITELHASFRTGLGLQDEDEILIDYQNDTPKGGD
ncbi:MAG: hypothetical protein NNA20_11020 [Nitrospira sp.]|nr:hypothetical protein [Nitrospira sp.]MCP9443113.1 hypothetical protein [Nitrospira sp.]